MAIPQSRKLREEETPTATHRDIEVSRQSEESAHKGPIVIREIEVLNDYVAILQFQIEVGTIELPDSAEKYKNEGLVVGIGPVAAVGSNKDLLCIGDVVMFGPRHKIAEIASSSPPYKGQRVIIVSEKNVICRLPVKHKWVKYDAEV